MISPDWQMQIWEGLKVWVTQSRCLSTHKTPDRLNLQLQHLLHFSRFRCQINSWEKQILLFPVAPSIIFCYFHYSKANNGWIYTPLTYQVISSTILIIFRYQFHT